MKKNVLNGSNGKGSKLKINRKNLKILIPAAICLFVFVVALSGRGLLSSLTSSVYNINDLSSLDNVNVGDTINYSVNGYSNWKVLSVDKNNGTVEVTSTTNTKNLTIQPYQSVDDYNQLFQNEANRFLDNNYVVSARTINKADSLLLNDNSEEYWLANVNENTLMTNKTGESGTSAIWHRNSFNVSEIYVVPYIGIQNPYNYIPDVGTKFELSKNGIDHWVYFGQTSGDYENVLFLVPEFPVALPVSSLEDIGTVSKAYFDNFDTSGIYGYGNWMEKFPHNFHDLIMHYYNTNVFDNTETVMYFVAAPGKNINTVDTTYHIEKIYGVGPNDSDNGNENLTQIYMYDPSNFVSSKPSKDVSVFYEPKSLTFGYRPVLTFKISDSKNVGTSLDAYSYLGDYVKYEANGYKNWKILSINSDAGTVDIISDGIVKNISLYGKDDYDNYENILQREVDAYKNGSNVVSARALQDSDIEKLNEISDSIEPFYWFNRKTQRRLDSPNKFQTGVIYNELNYDVGVLSSRDVKNGTTGNVVGYWVSLYNDAGNLNNDTVSYVADGNLSFIAGLRPVITLKYETIDIYLIQILKILIMIQKRIIKHIIMNKKQEIVEVE